MVEGGGERRGAGFRVLRELKRVRDGDRDRDRDRNGRLGSMMADLAYSKPPGFLGIEHRPPPLSR